MSFSGCVLFSILACFFGGTEPSALELASAHAPIIFQQVDPTNRDSDYITSLDYDGDLNLLNNWDNTDRGVDDPVLYYSVVETSTHWYILYGVYHSRDWSSFARLPDFEHENDFEGLLITVLRDGSRTGTAMASLTVNHRIFEPYSIADVEVSGYPEGTSPIMSLDRHVGGGRPMVLIESGGHGVRAFGLEEESLAPEAEGIMYAPAIDGDREPLYGWDDTHLYDMVPIDWLWDEQLDFMRQQLAGEEGDEDEPPLFEGWGRLDGDRSGSCGETLNLFCTDDSARLPWAWTDFTEEIQPGLTAVDPALLLLHYFYDTGQVDRRYDENMYLEAVPECSSESEGGGLPDSPFVAIEVDLVCG